MCKALDYLAIGVHEIGSLSGCRMERLVNHGMSGLPAFLTLEGGLNSGFMIAHCTAAALSKYIFGLICLWHRRSFFIYSLGK